MQVVEYRMLLLTDFLLSNIQVAKCMILYKFLFCDAPTHVTNIGPAMAGLGPWLDLLLTLALMQSPVYQGILTDYSLRTPRSTKQLFYFTIPSLCPEDTVSYVWNSRAPL